MNNATNVILSGLVWSGSGTIRDLLKEYDDVSLVPGEFNDFRAPGKIGDALETNCRHTNWRNFRKERMHFRIRYYLLLTRSLLPDVLFFRIFKNYKMTRNEAYDELYGMGKRLKDISQLKKVLKQIETENYSQNKLTIAKQWFQSISKKYAHGKSFVVFDQPIILESHLNTWPVVLSPFKLIVVYREPKDQMASVIKYANHIFFDNLPWPMEVLMGRDKESKRGLRLLAETTLMRMRKLHEIENKICAENRLIISFEELVTNYDCTKEKIEKFLGLDPALHKRKRRYFDPDKSIANIGIYPEFLNNKDIEMLEELNKMYLERVNQSSYV